MDLAQCNLTYAYILYKLLKSKNVEFSEPSDLQKEFQVHHRITQLLFPIEYTNFSAVRIHTQNPNSN